MFSTLYLAWKQCKPHLSLTLFLSFSLSLSLFRFFCVDVSQNALCVRVKQKERQVQDAARTLAVHIQDIKHFELIFREGGISLSLLSLSLSLSLSISKVCAWPMLIELQQWTK